MAKLNGLDILFSPQLHQEGGVEHMQWAFEVSAQASTITIPNRLGKIPDIAMISGGQQAANSECAVLFTKTDALACGRVWEDDSGIEHRSIAVRNYGANYSFAVHIAANAKVMAAGTTAEQIKFAAGTNSYFMPGTYTIDVWAGVF